MKLDKAIEILTTGSPAQEHTSFSDWDNAIKLAIEALREKLKREKEGE